ncbi:hypothetical protein LSH36_145g07021 [Paralvinella palmiformis]|uniref:Uncharacterized protein n=1 Tax=Paralvinella palmiformis TaxID=53620 RepID=A0AAD9JWN6_9ANNE|nr:hypothetical protein LSH36_145g07021 [Paralvinella palmiformis]
MESLRIRLRVEDHKGIPMRSNRDLDNWSNLRKQIHEFTATTQQELELERAHLLSKNAMLSQEVEELRNYIDNHLVRYKEEINGLRQMLGIGDPVAMGFTSPPLRH